MPVITLTKLTDRSFCTDSVTVSRVAACTSARISKASPAASTTDGIQSPSRVMLSEGKYRRVRALNTR